MRWPIERFRALPLTVQDGLLALAVGVIDVELFSAQAFTNWVVNVYAAAGVLALTWRRRWPVIVFAVLLAHNLAAFWVEGYSPVLILLIALYTVAAHSAIRLSVAALLLTFGAYFVAAVNEAFAMKSDQWRTLLAFLVFYGLQTGGAWGLGRWVRLSRRHAAMLDYRRQMEAAQAVAGERVRIARELHDIVAHSVTVMMLQSATAARAVRTAPDRAEEALAEVDGLGLQTMDELRRMLIVLRPEDGGTVEPAGDAQPSLQDLEALVNGVRGAGISVDLRTTGNARPLDSSVGLTVYRTVQEALTNVTKHAGPGAHVRVDLEWLGDDLRVSVVNDASGSPRRVARVPSSGRGLSGVRERMEMIGGSLENGPTPDGGYRLSATLPVIRRSAVPAG
ncbi:sensor histidine kinase [Nonomuraea insulae]|uniref:histidine kinase n=1 Tax=Nonomuraea insulae TaxID=1616787 RepID=A0ABW1CG08_9ACTN